MGTTKALKRQVRHNEALRSTVAKGHGLHARTEKRKELKPNVQLQDLIAEGLILMLLSIDLQDATQHKHAIECLLRDLQNQITSGVITSNNKFTIILIEIQRTLVDTLNTAGKTDIKLSFRPDTVQKWWSALEAFRTSTLKKAPKKIKKELPDIQTLEGIDVEVKTEIEGITETKPKTITKEMETWGLLPANAELPKSTGFQLPGEIGKLLGNIIAYKYSIVLTGDPHAGKTEVLMQILDGFLGTGKKVALFSVEQGGIESELTTAAIDRNVSSTNKGKLLVSAQAPSMEQLKLIGQNFDVVAIDSWQKLNLPNTRFDELRHECPNTIWITIFQQNGEGGTRGGVSADYDSPVILKVHKVDKTFVNNYVEVKKNRGNRLDRYYLVANKKIHEGFEPPSPNG